MNVPKKYSGETAVIVATGPSINNSQIEYVADAHHYGSCRIITVNNSYQLLPETDIQVACNDNWWDYYWKNCTLLPQLKADMWTRYRHQADSYGINYIDSIEQKGLSRDPSVIHIGHGSGPMAINFATLYGFKKIILIGHDMKYGNDYNGAKKNPGSTPRHYFGEYPKELQHFPQSKASVDAHGNIIGLIGVYHAMKDDLKSLGVDVVNCTPGSALNTFRMSTLQKEL